MENLMIKENYFIITGGPGMGKTAIIEQLRLKGYACVPETGRNIIQQQMAIQGTALPWANSGEFALLMFRQSVLDYQQHLHIQAPVFFDRGIPDTIGYLQLCGLPVLEEMIQAAETLRSNTQVFITPPWEEIFHHDEERKQSFEEAVRTYEQMQQLYAYLGYSLTVLPKVSVAERIACILPENR